MKIFVIGGANLDIYAKVNKDRVVLYDSNPSHISFSYGGVARNIVENIANMQAKPYFISVFGNDAMGLQMYNDLKKKGVNLDYSLIDEQRTTSSYLAVLDADDMYVACSDMSLIEDMKVEQLEKLKPIIDVNDFVVFDANLSINIINYICNSLKGIKVFDAISTTKVTKINDLLDKIDVVKLNKLEAEALSLKKIENESDIKDIAISLYNKGLKKSLISWGSKLFVCERSKVIKYEHFGLRENPVNVTGAGDSLIGNYVYALSKGQNEDDAVAFGLSAAILTVDVMSAVRDLTKEMIIKNIKTLNIQKGEL